MTKKAEYFFAVLLSILVPIALYFLVGFMLAEKLKSNSIEQSVASEVGIRKKDESPIRLLFLGDIMLDRTIRKDGERYGYDNLFSCLADTFAKYDSVIGNLEGTVTDFPSVSKDASYQAPESFRFTFDITAVKALQDIGLSVVSLANNHIRDFGDDGVAQTINNLDSIGLKHFGSPGSTEQRWVIEEINGTRIAYVGYNQFFGTVGETTSDLRTVQEVSDMQIVFAHWGDEYVPATENMKSLARTFVDSGADIVIGAHPHIVQESENYKDVTIYYSLGNFIFDQYFEQAVTEGIAVGVQISDKKITSTKELKVKSVRHKGSCFVE